MHRVIAALDRDVAANRHRVPGVQNQIQNGRFKLPGIDPAIPQLRLAVQPDAHGFPRRLCQQFARRRQDLINRDGLRPQHLLARIRQQLSRQTAAALCRALDHFGTPGGVRIAARFRTHPQRRRIAEHDSQQIIEVVRDAAGQPAERLHLLGLIQRITRLMGLDATAEQSGGSRLQARIPAGRNGTDRHDSG